MTPIQEVAKLAKVSVATVSRVLNNSAGVKEETRIKVMEAVKALNYRPNLSGRFLRRSETRLVLVLLPTISNPFYAKAINGIQRMADKHGYLIMIGNTESEPAKEIEYINLAKNRLADGIIVMTQELELAVFKEMTQDIAVVQCFEYFNDPELAYISIDNEKAACEAVSRLIAQGHRRIGLLGITTPYQSACQREEGYRQALQNASLPIDESLVTHGTYGFKSGYENTRRLLAGVNPPTAVFALSDAQAIGAVKAIKSAGLRVPEDISVMGFDNIRFATMFSPTISTVSQPTFRIGQKAMEVLIEMMQAEQKTARQIIMNHQVILRESTGPARE